MAYNDQCAAMILGCIFEQNQAGTSITGGGGGGGGSGGGGIWNNAGAGIYLSNVIGSEQTRSSSSRLNTG